MSTERSLVTRQEQNQCRICLQYQEPDRQPMISPCLCKGSIQFVHSECLQQYFSHRFQMASATQRKRMKKALKCQICKHTIRTLRVRPKKRCITCAQLRQQVQTQDIIFFIVFVFLYFGFHGVGVLIILQDSLVAKIVGAIWLVGCVIAFNLFLFQILRKTLIVYDPSVQVVDPQLALNQLIQQVQQQGEGEAQPVVQQATQNQQQRLVQM